MANEILGEMEKIIVQNIAPDFRSYSRRGSRRIAALRNYCYNEEDGRKDKQDWTIVFFLLPKTKLESKWTRRFLERCLKKRKR